jgi:hypothetical protein
VTGNKTQIVDVPIFAAEHVPKVLDGYMEVIDPAHEVSRNGLNLFIGRRSFVHAQPIHGSAVMANIVAGIQPVDVNLVWCKPFVANGTLDKSFDAHGQSPAT